MRTYSELDDAEAAALLIEGVYRGEREGERGSLL